MILFDEAFLVYDSIINKLLHKCEMLLASVSVGKSRLISICAFVISDKIIDSNCIAWGVVAKGEFFDSSIACSNPAKVADGADELLKNRERKEDKGK